jgi:hypothetical protein
MDREIITSGELYKKYTNEWVFLVNCEIDSTGSFSKGEIVHHSPDRNDVFKKMYEFQEQKGKQSLIFTGKVVDHGKTKV